MKKKIIFAISALMVVVLVLSACSGKKAYKFINEESEMSTIEIVRLCEYDQEKEEFKEELISVIENRSDFLSDFKKVECYNHWSDPNGVHEGDVVIKITYKNGEYELINHSGQGKYRHFEDNPSFLQVYAGYRDFDEEQFNDLIKKYSCSGTDAE